MAIEEARKLLRELERFELAALLEFASYRVDREMQWAEIEWWTETMVIAAPDPFYEALETLPERDQKRICEAIMKTDPELQAYTAALETRFVLAQSPQLQPEQTLVADVVRHRNQMRQVGRGAPRIPDVDDYYRARRRRIAQRLQALQLDDPNPHEDLWSWHKKYKAEGWGYQDRDRYVEQLYAPLLAQLCTIRPEPAPAREPTGWERVDRALTKARMRLEAARDEEDYQGVGLLCREVLISLGQAVYDPARHHTPDGVTPSATDGRRMIEAYVASEFTGSAHKEIRAHAKASLDLAVTLQHRRTAAFRFTALCLESTSSLVNQLAILSGRRDRD